MANPFSSIRQFYKETVTELKRASWPKYHEIGSSMVLVFVAILLLGAFIALADFSALNVVDFCRTLAKGGK